MLRKSDRYKNDRTEVEGQMNVIEQKQNDLMAEKLKITDKLNLRDNCKEKLQRHLQKVQKLKSQTIGKLFKYSS